ncbi:hypothetical protein F0562_029670 [Nyssa sinensis]|uniref:Thiamine pyrophosphate enzyme TPP-binding domain-containing protein n=1 Tax=Nyssa sinensis TaxID=561372 RepID=A0A5J5B3K6_9ASTE|nr:hypothetical protein F0562_029670 [Nyssa sinensis]
MQSRYNINDFVHEAQTRWLTSGGLGAMGSELPATIGATVTRPDAVVWTLMVDCPIFYGLSRGLSWWCCEVNPWTLCYCNKLGKGEHEAAVLGKENKSPVSVPLQNGHVESSTGVMSFEDNAKRVDWQDQASNVKEKQALLAAKQGAVGATLRYLGLKSVMVLLGPMLWGTILADVVIRMLGTDYARILQADYAFAQILYHSHI